MVDNSLDLTIVVVTSPFASLPSTAVIDYVIQSFNLIDGLSQCPIKIVMDGYKVCNENRTKKGRITRDMEELYNEYYEKLKELYCDPEKHEILRCGEHLGFAHCVKYGLERCQTTFALVAQHDRFFQHSFDRLPTLLQAMRDHSHIRYIGFPSTGNITHDKSIQFVYHLGILNEPPTRITLDKTLALQPLIFWFDSQHLCHIERYLRIFTPFKTIPPTLKPLVGLQAIKDMFLKPGDFIEDKFGQVQRNLLIQFAAKVWEKQKKAAEASEDTEDNGEAGSQENEQEEKPANELEKSDPLCNIDNSTILELFRWYGSYLCWITNPVGNETNAEAPMSDLESGACSEESEISDARDMQAWIHSKSTNVTLAMVSHLHGRHFNVSKIQEYVEKVGYHRITSKKFLRLIDSNCLGDLKIESTNSVTTGDSEEVSQ